MVYIVISSSRTSQIIDVSLRLVSAFVALFMINREMNASYKLAWIFMILLLPLFGGLFYLTCVCQASTRRFKKDVTAIDARCKHYLKPEPDCLNELADAGKAVSTARYLQNCAGFPLCKDTETQFLCPGERFFEAALRELEQAKRYIFLEYYIIRDGEMWNAVLEILKRKAAEGVDVRVLYDDFGCFLSFSRRYRRYLQECGIKCRVFNSFRPILTTVQNNRDHRKIMVIDGRVGFTGGINLADEYINRDSPLGHWKDAAILLRGNAVKNLVGIFFSLWYRRAGRRNAVSAGALRRSVRTSGGVLHSVFGFADGQGIGGRARLSANDQPRHPLYQYRHAVSGHRRRGDGGADGGGKRRHRRPRDGACARGQPPRTADHALLFPASAARGRQAIRVYPRLCPCKNHRHRRRMRRRRHDQFRLPQLVPAI